jgi:outer membrane protein TolC
MKPATPARPAMIVFIAVAASGLAAPAAHAQRQPAGQRPPGGMPAPRPQPGQPAPASQPAQPSGQPAPAGQGAPAGAPGQVVVERAPPAGVQSMRLSELLSVTARQEPSLMRAIIDVRIAEAAVLEAAGIDDWALQVSGGWRSQRFVVPVSGLQNSLDLQADLSRALSTGGTVTLHADTGFSRFSLDTPGTDATSQYTHTVYAALSQPLWRGFGEKYSRSGQARARIARSAAELDLQQAALAAVRQVISAYWELAYAWRDIEIRRASLVLAQEQLRNTQARISAGAVAPTEALAVEQSIASREEAILQAQLSITDSSLALRDLSGLEIGPGEVALWADAPVDITPQQFDVNALLAEALEQYPALEALRVRKQDLSLAVDLAEDDTDPALDLDLLLGPTGSGETPVEALEGLSRFRELTVNARLTLRHAFGQRTARGRLEAARQRLQQLDIDINNLQVTIKRNLILAVQQAETAQQRIVLSERVIELAQRNIEAEKARFELGRATNFDVLQRQDELEQAQLRRARAVIDYLQALTAIDAATGGLLGRYGITLVPAEG